MWKDILKIQIQQGGYAQLDFDNIMEEEDDDCKRKVKQIVDNFASMQFSRKEVGSYGGQDAEDGVAEPYSKSQTIRHYYHPNEEYHTLSLSYEWSDMFPEEVYCKVLEVIADDKATNIQFAGYSITLLREVFPTHNVKKVIVHAGGKTRFLIVGYIYHIRDKDNPNTQLISKLESAFNVV